MFNYRHDNPIPDSDQFFQLAQQLFQYVVSFLPESVSGNVYPGQSRGFRRRSGTSARKQGVVARYEPCALQLILPVDRQHEQLGEGIGVAVETGVDEVGDIAPAPSVGIDHLDRIAEQLAVLLKPEFTDPGIDQQPLVPLQMKPLFESGQHDLPESRSNDVLYLSAEERNLDAGVGFRVQHLSRQEHLAEDGSSLCKRQRRVIIDHALLSGEYEMQGMAEFVGNGRHIAQIRSEIQENIRGYIRRDPHAEGPAALAAAGMNIDPPLVKERFDQLPIAGVEAAIGVEYEIPGLLEGVLSGVLGQRGINVGVLELVNSEQ